MKIGIITSWMRLGWGVDLTVHLTACALHARGHEVRLYAANHDGSYSLAPYELIHTPVVSHWFFPRFEWRARVYIKYFNDEPNDIYLIATQPFYYYPLVLKKPVVHWEFGIVPTTGFSLRQKIMWAYMRATQYHVYHPAANAVASISNFTTNMMTPRVRRKTTAIYLGVDHYDPLNPDHDRLFPTPLLQPDPDHFGKPLSDEVPVDRRTDEELRKEFRDEHGISDDDVVGLYVGRINPENQPYKGTNKIFDLVKKLGEKYPNFKFVMVGLGTDEDANKCRDAGIIPLMNYPDWKMRQVFNGCDMYITASKWEGFNLPLVEAQYFGKPVVAYDLAAHPEVVKKDVTGFLVRDNTEFEDKICQLIEDKDLRTKMGSEGRGWAGQFNWMNTALGFENLFDRILTGLNS